MKFSDWYWGVRRQANLCLSHNHLGAFDYPLGRLADETAFIVSRENTRITTEANLLQQAVAGILSKEARGAFRKHIESLTIDVKPIEGIFGESSQDMGLFEDM